MVSFGPGGFDADASEHVRKSRHSADAATKALLIAASYIRAGKPLPMGMDSWLADAFEEAVKNPWRYAPRNGDIGHALLVRLGLKSNSRRKNPEWLEIAILADEKLKLGMSEAEVASDIAASQGVCEKSVLNYLYEYAPRRKKSVKRPHP